MSLHFASAVEVADGVRSGEYDPVDVVESFLERIDSRNDVTNAFVTVLEERFDHVDGVVLAGADPVGHLDRRREVEAHVRATVGRSD